MLVYRLEHRTAINQHSGLPCGPYNPAPGVGRENRAAFEELLSALLDYSFNDRHMTPNSDPFLRGIYANEVCAFTSQEWLDAWFGPFVKELARYGFHVACYDVPADSLRVGVNGQCVFKARSGKMVTDKGENVD